MPIATTRRQLLQLPDPPAQGEVLLVVVLRGGADALNLIVPYGEERYYQLRPALAIPRPDDSDRSARCVALDDRFGLHPALTPLLEAWRDEELLVVHAVGSDDRTRSHFEAQDSLEHAGGAGGWLSRLARAEGTRGSGAVAWGSALPESLRGAPGVSVIQSLADMTDRLRWSASYDAALRALYGAASGALGVAGRETLDTVRRLTKIPAATEQQRARYPNHDFGRGLCDIAQLIRAQVGVTLACVDLGGWDTHFVQGELLGGQADILARGLAAFREHLGSAARRVTTVVVSEFGRRAYENSSLGTDHGRAGVMLVSGARIRGGRVLSEWPGLAQDQLEPPGDLRVTIDYREILAPIVAARVGSQNVEEVFPGLESRRLPVLRSG